MSFWKEEILTYSPTTRRILKSIYDSHNVTDSDSQVRCLIDAIGGSGLQEYFMIKTLRCGYEHAVVDLEVQAVKHIRESLTPEQDSQLVIATLRPNQPESRTTIDRIVGNATRSAPVQQPRAYVQRDYQPCFV